MIPSSVQKIPVFFRPQRGLKMNLKINRSDEAVPFRCDFRLQAAVASGYMELSRNQPIINVAPTTPVPTSPACLSIANESETEIVRSKKAPRFFLYKTKSGLFMSR